MIKHEKNFHIKGKIIKKPPSGKLGNLRIEKGSSFGKRRAGRPANKRARLLPCSCCSFGCLFWKLRGTLTRAAGQLCQREKGCHPSGCLPVWIPFSWGHYRLGSLRSPRQGCCWRWWCRLWDQALLCKVGLRGAEGGLGCSSREWVLA